MKKLLLFLSMLSASNVIIPSNHRSNAHTDGLFKNIFNSWKKVVCLEWNEVSFFDICNIGASTLCFVLAKKLFIEALTVSSSKKTVETGQNNLQHPAYTPTIAQIPINQQNQSNEKNVALPINQNLVSNEQANYLRISQQCAQIRQYFASTGSSRSSSLHHAIYQYLISENSSAARRVMEELIHSKQLMDYRSGYGIK